MLIYVFERLMCIIPVVARKYTGVFGKKNTVVPHHIFVKGTFLSDIASFQIKILICIRIKNLCIIYFFLIVCLIWVLVLSRKLWVISRTKVFAVNFHQWKNKDIWEIILYLYIFVKIPLLTKQRMYYPLFSKYTIYPFKLLEPYQNYLNLTPLFELKNCQNSHSGDPEFHNYWSPIESTLCFLEKFSLAGSSTKDAK